MLCELLKQDCTVVQRNFNIKIPIGAVQHNCTIKLKHPLLCELLQLDWAVVLHCYNRNFYIEVASHDCEVLLKQSI